MCGEADAEEFGKERKSLMDSMEVKVIRAGFSAVNENLTDIAKSLQKLSTKEEECWRTVESDGCPGPEYEWVLAIVSCDGNIDNVPIVAKFDRKAFCWIVHFANGYLDHPLNSNYKVVRWAPIFGDSSDILCSYGKEIERVYCYGE